MRKNYRLPRYKLEKYDDQKIQDVFDDGRRFARPDSLWLSIAQS